MSAPLMQPALVAQQERPARTASNLNPEFELLLACCKPNPTTALAGALRHPIDWPKFVAAAEHHGAVPQVCEKLSFSGSNWPPEAEGSIRESYQSNAKRTLWLSRELARVVEHFESCNIPALPYKGPALAEVLYGDVIRRQFSDLDILVRARDIPRAKIALRDVGFSPGIEFTPREERSFLRSGYELTFESPNGRNLLELQWQIMPRFYAIDFDIEGFFERAVSQSVVGVTIRALCAEDLLLVLCAHAAKHLWIQLSWLCDVSALVNSARIDWDLVWSQADKLGIRRLVEATFTLAHQLLDTPLPPAMQADSHVQMLVAEIIPLIVRSAPFDNESMAYFRLFAQSRERPLDRARFWWRLATTPSVGEWSAVRLPAPLFPLYHIVRITRLRRRILGN